MKKTTAFLLLLTLCLCATLCALGETVRIPATSEAVLAELPVALPPMPVITKGQDPYSYVIEGLDEWPIEEAEMFGSGVYMVTPNIRRMKYEAINGREDEPFTVIFTEDDMLKGKAFLLFAPTDTKAVSYMFEFDEYYENRSNSITLRFKDDITCVLDMNGVVVRYSTKDSGYIYYNTDGILKSYDRTYDDISITYAGDGSVLSASINNNDEIKYSYYADSGWRDSSNKPCEPPKDFDFADYPPAVLYQ